MSRATRLARVPRGAVHVARLGGFYTPSQFDHADALVVNSHGLADHLIAAGLPAKRVHLIGNFVDTPRICSADELATRRAALPLPADAWLLLAVGRCVPVKGWDVLLAALSQLPTQIGGRPLALLLLGAGPLRPALQRQAQQLGVAGRVHFAGWVDDPAPYYQLADAVVFPSRAGEALGNVILETWAQARALVTTASCGARELVRPGIDALQVPCDDAGALARAIERLLGDEPLRAALAEAGAVRAAREFGRDAVIGAYLDLYRQLLGV
jgi:glycosyltransferase involved in cell wall biosynthesis